MSAPLLQPYQTDWPLQAEAAMAPLRALFDAPDAVQLEHIGSTAVTGLCAKPVLDLLLGLQSLAQVEARIPALAQLGYRYRQEYETQLPQRRYFVRDAGPHQGLRVHLHAVLRGGDLWRQQLGFRDALRTSPELAQRYATLKQELALRHAGDKAAYTEAKAPFIVALLAKLG
jgi:GrpB-like predicted nucleotidyltransferase (UPF0157 family)